MKRHLIVVWALVLLTLAVDVAAQTPRVVRHSGVVRDAAGQVRTGGATVTFALYAEAEGGAPLWVEVQAVALDSQGRYAVALGATQPEGLPLDLFTSGAARWLGVAVDGGAELPRVALLSVPYALQAADATTIGGKPLSAFVLAGEQTGRGADGLTYVNPVLLQAAAESETPQATSGTPGYLGVFTNTTDLGNSVMFQSGSSIGVNTTAPAANFHAVATSAPGAFFDVYSDTLGALPVVYRAARGTPGAPTAVQTDDILGGLAVRGYGATGFSGGQGQVMFKAAEPWTDAAHGTYLQLTTTPLGSATWAERMRITPAGNVGIGTTTPGQKLSVAGTIESTTGGFKFPDGSVQTLAATSDTVGHNIGFGYWSLHANTTGQSNAAFGEYALSANTTGSGNSAFGYFSLLDNTTGSVNTAVGNSTLQMNTTGSFNTAVGFQSLRANTTGNWNAGVGYQSLYANTTGYSNTAVGYFSLNANTTGTFNAAFGADSLRANTTGNYNTAVGKESLHQNTTGFKNSAFGTFALAATTTGWDNTAVGYISLCSNTTGSYNTAVGEASLDYNTTGSGNTAVGSQSLFVNTTGNYNIGIGAGAGSNLTDGHSNIDIGHAGVAGEGNTIRIGTSQTRTFMAGIRGVTTGAADAVAVLIDSNGQLGTVNSSRRVKDDIADMGTASRGLMQLRPVTFYYKSDQAASVQTLQYGLIAEEVAEVYPGLVARSADGEIETVLYQFLPPMLLNEYQRQQRTIETLQVENETLRAQLAALADRLARLEARDRH